MLVIDFFIPSTVLQSHNVVPPEQQFVHKFPTLPNNFSLRNQIYLSNLHYNVSLEVLRIPLLMNWLNKIGCL